MTVILAIDAAWTNTEPSGVALVARNSNCWKCLCVAPSYDAFLACAENIPVDWETSRFGGSTPHIPSLLSAAQKIAGAKVDLITLDMPITTDTLTSRRAADNEVSKIFGGRGCSTHSPNSKRPGRLGTNIANQLCNAGYPLATAIHSPGTLMRTIEVYPHPALLRLLNRDYRVPYKVAKSRNYWPELVIQDRIARLLDEFKEIERALTNIFGHTGLRIPDASDIRTLAMLKRYEDSIDGLVCAWIGVQYVNCAAKPYGDHKAAIWIP